MKKFLLSAATLMAAMSVNAQVESAFIDADNVFAGIEETKWTDDKGKEQSGYPVEAGHLLCSSDNVTMKIAYQENGKITALAGENDNAKTVTIGGVTYKATKGVTGNQNPTASITEASTNGFVIQFDVKKDGYIYAICKLSSNKPYYVWEGKAGEGEALVAYSLTMHMLDETTPIGAELNYTLPADADGYFDASAADADKYTDGTALRWPEKIVLGAEAEDVKKNGLGIIKFPVYADAETYLLHATGSKVSIDGFVFSPTELEMKVNKVGEEPGETPVEAEIWTIAGVGTMMGSSWDQTDATNDLKSTDGKIYTLVKEGVVLEKGVTYEYKAAKDHAWTESYPSSNATLTVEETGTYTIIFTFNSETKELTAKAEKTGEATIGEKTYSVIGTINGNWDNDTYMDGANGLYMAMFPNVKAGTYEFKVRVDGKWDEAYPSSNYKLELEKDANVAVLFNSETKEVSVEIVKTTIGAEDNTTAYLGDHSMLIPLSELGGGCNIKFTNYSSKANNWNNWVAVITNNYAEPFAEGAIKIALRADNWENIQWSNEGVTSNFNWDTFKDDMDGSTVEMTVDRAVNGDVKIHADITTAAGTKYFEEFTKNLGTEEALYFCLSVDGSHLELLPVDDPTAIQSAKAQAKAGIRYNLAGQKVDANYKGIVIENGKKFMVK